MAVTKESNPGVKNYITPGGLQRLKDELRFLLAKERPAVTQVVAWAASNGDRSENADYQYNKRRLRSDRSTPSLSHETYRRGGGGGSRSRAKWARREPRVLRSDCSVRERRRHRAGGAHRRRRRDRSESQPYQLEVAAGARIDEVWARGLCSPSRAAWHRGTPGPRCALRAHPGGAVQRTTRRRGRTQATSSYRNRAASTGNGSGVKVFESHLSFTPPAVNGSALLVTHNAPVERQDVATVCHVRRLVGIWRKFQEFDPSAPSSKMNAPAPRVTASSAE